MLKVYLNTWQEMSWLEIRQRLIVLLPKFVFVLLVILLAQTFAQITWKIFAGGGAAVSVSSNTQSPQNPQSINSGSATASLNKVSQYHLFGEVTRQPVIQKVIDAPDTSLHLTLKGVFAASDPASSIAIIAGGKGEDKTYYIGDKISGGATLHAVYDDRVILKRNGRLETLRLPKPRMDSASIVDSPVSTFPVVENSLPVSGKAGLRELRDTFLKDPAKIWENVRITPVMENGTVKGYSVLHNNQALMKSLNIRPTDIITSVNGQALSDPSTLYALMNDLQNAKSIQLTIERDGQQQEIELNF